MKTKSLVMLCVGVLLAFCFTSCNNSNEPNNIDQASTLIIGSWLLDKAASYEEFEGNRTNYTEKQLDSKTLDFKSNGSVDREEVSGGNHVPVTLTYSISGNILNLGGTNWTILKIDQQNLVIETSKDIMGHPTINHEVYKRQ